MRTGPLALPPRAGEVALYIIRRPPVGTELGIVEVRAAHTEARIENLFPVFMSKVAALGGDMAVIDSVETKFQIVERSFAETYAYPCGSFTCAGTRWLPVADEVMMLFLRGRALTSKVPETP